MRRDRHLTEASNNQHQACGIRHYSASSFGPADRTEFQAVFKATAAPVIAYQATGTQAAGPPSCAEHRRACASRWRGPNGLFSGAAGRGVVLSCRGGRCAAGRTPHINDCKSNTTPARPRLHPQLNHYVSTLTTQAGAVTSSHSTGRRRVARTRRLTHAMEARAISQTNGSECQDGDG